MLTCQSYAITCNHVIDSATRIRAHIRIPGRLGDEGFWHNVHVVKADPECDLAFLNMLAGPVSYIITPDFLLNKNRNHNGYIPDSDVFHSKHKWESFTTAVRTFRTHGRYLEKCLGHVNTGFYRRKHELIAYSYSGISHHGLIAYKNAVYATSYVSKKRLKGYSICLGKLMQ